MHRVSGRFSDYLEPESLISICSATVIESVTLSGFSSISVQWMVPCERLLFLFDPVDVYRQLSFRVQLFNWSLFVPKANILQTTDSSSEESIQGVTRNKSLTLSLLSARSSLHPHKQHRRNHTSSRDRYFNLINTNKFAFIQHAKLSWAIVPRLQSKQWLVPGHEHRQRFDGSNGLFCCSRRRHNRVS